jgi:hypothetical protein
MNWLFGKKETFSALAELLEDGRELMNNEMKRKKFNNYSGPEVFLEVSVRVQPEVEPAFEAKMKVGLLNMYLLKPGVRVKVIYDPAKPAQVTFDDDAPSILGRNSQLKKE